MSPSEIAKFAYAAGFRGYDLVVAVATAMGESSGNPQAVGDTTLANSTWGPSVGLWQIRTLKGQTGTGQTRDISKLNDPLANARSAYELYRGRGGGFQDWTVYKTGAYRNYLGAAQDAVRGLGGDIGNLPEYTPGQLAETVSANGQTTGPQLPTEEEVKGLFRDLLGIVPSADQLARYTGKTLKDTEKQLSSTEGAADWSAYKGFSKLQDL